MAAMDAEIPPKSLNFLRMLADVKKQRSKEVACLVDQTWQESGLLLSKAELNNTAPLGVYLVDHEIAEHPDLNAAYFCGSGKGHRSIGEGHSIPGDHPPRLKRPLRDPCTRHCSTSTTDR